jgi:DNA modification methylase
MKFVKGQGFRLFNANCFSVLKEMVRTNAKVDLIVLDLPYGETNNHWDSKIDLQEVWNFQKDKPNKSRKYHPTSKSVSLYEYIIKTYSKEGETVLDFCLGGGGNIFTACQNLNRKFIGVGLDTEYFEQFIIPKIQVPFEECVIQELEIKGE